MKYITWFDKIGMKDLSKVGGKGASLGEMYSNLSLEKNGVRVPYGFVLTTDAFRRFISKNDLQSKINTHLSKIKEDCVASLRREGLAIRTLISNSSLPSDIVKEVTKSYFQLSQRYLDTEGSPQLYTDVAVRSSSVAEDTKDASFAGQQDTILNVRGDTLLLDSIISCFASLYTDRAISYRLGIKYEGCTDLAIVVQKMVRSDLGASGVGFSLDTDTGHPNIMVINGTLGLGELLVQGQVTPDEFLLFKPFVGTDCKNPIVDKRLGSKKEKMVYASAGRGSATTQVVSLTSDQQSTFCLEDSMILLLGDWIRKIEIHYDHPVDVEWALDGLSGDLFIVQARPETIHSKKTSNPVHQMYSLSPGKETPLVEGIAVGSTIGQGPIQVMHSLDSRYDDRSDDDFQDGAVLVTDMTDPDWEPIMKRASAIVTNKGGRCSHCAIVARELGIPAVVGCENATDVLDGLEGALTVSCASGQVGKVFKGAVPFSVKEIDLEPLTSAFEKFPLMLNVGSPDTAFSSSLLPSRGVGLAREEFIISNFIQVHPRACLEIDRLDTETRSKVESLTKGYKSPADFFVEKLSFGIARIAAAFHPRNVILRFSDFKSNEYRGLLGGAFFEPEEENPMIGWRGASRYYSSDYKEAFGLECRAIKRVREEMGLENLVVMVPFCRTPGEMRNVLQTMEEFGLKRGERSLKVFLMCEVPSNVILASEFASLIDGFSIGSNDLTQLTLGLDRDSHLVAHLYDERNEAVKTMIRQVVKIAQEKGVKIGICGQGPSDFPDFAAFLMELGIDSISVTPDSLFRTYSILNESL